MNSILDLDFLPALSKFFVLKIYLVQTIFFYFFLFKCKFKQLINPIVKEELDPIPDLLGKSPS